MEDLTQHLPCIVVRNAAVDKICHGTVITSSDILAYTHFKKNQLLQILTAKSELIGIGESLSSTGQFSGKICQPKKILMPRGTY